MLIDETHQSDWLLALDNSCLNQYILLTRHGTFYETQTFKSQQCGTPSGLRRKLKSSYVSLDEESESEADPNALASKGLEDKVDTMLSKMRSMLEGPQV